jgi:hypothetical protein
MNWPIAKGLPPWIRAERLSASSLIGRMAAAQDKPDFAFAKLSHLQDELCSGAADVVQRIVGFVQAAKGRGLVACLRFRARTARSGVIAAG